MSQAADKSPVEGVEDLGMGNCLLDLRAIRALDLRNYYLSSGKTEKPKNSCTFSVLLPEAKWLPEIDKGFHRPDDDS